jgi:radical SAM superfamily enzyme YgiQ (UPF0313 family)
MKVLMVYPRFPEETYWNALRSVKLFMRRRGEMPPLGLLTVAAHLPADFEVRLVDRNVSEETDADWQWADVVFFSVMLAQRADYARCVAKAKAHDKPFAVGGPFTHGMPEELRAEADWICFGEVESVADELVADLRAGRLGRRYMGGNKTDMSTVKAPRFEILPKINDYAVMAVQFSRGCPFQCEFCDIIEIYGRVPRAKAPAQLLAELDELRRRGFTGYVFLVDDNFIGNKKKAKAMLEELAAWNLRNGHPFWFFTELSINVADDAPLLEAMARAGLRRVFIGIETPDPALLKTTRKLQNIPGDSLAKLKRIREHGIHVTAGFIIGFDGEDAGVFDAQRTFIQASGIGVAIPGLLQALPGTQLARRLEKEGRLLPSADLSLITTLEGINFVPKGGMTRRQYLERYRGLVKELFAPAPYFERIVPAVLALRGISRVALSRLLRKHFPTFLRLVYHLGVRGQGYRRTFWKALLRVLWRNPTALEAFGHDCFYFYHLHRHADFVDRELRAYLSSPGTDGHLDEVVPGAALPVSSGSAA